MMTRISILLAALLCFAAASTHSAGNAQRTRELAAVLKSDASVFEKARACQQLSEIGTGDAVPDLAALLSDEHLNAYARSGLESISDPSAAEALRNALNTTKGAQLRGVINSLGVIRDTKAVPALCQLTSDSDSGIVKDALLALGRISTPESIEFIRKTLSVAPDAIRAEAAAACLLAAEKQIVTGNIDAAVRLYDAVRTSAVPASCRIGAIRGAIIARKSAGVPLLIEQLTSTDSAAQLGALTTVREIPSDALAEALNSQLSTAKPELQRQIITALIDCHNQKSLDILRAKASDSDAAVRENALTTLGQIGGAPEAKVLISSVAAKRSSGEVSIATVGLRRIKAEGIDELIAQAVAESKDSDTRTKLIRLLGSRRATGVNAELLRQVAGQDASSAVAAWDVLSSLAGVSDIPALISSAKSSSDQTRRSAAEAALATACERIGDSAADLVLAELQKSDDAAKPAWVRILTIAGCAKALPTIESLLASNNEALASTVAEQLGRWPDPAPVEGLLAWIDKTGNPALRNIARSSVIQLAGATADERQRPDAAVISWLRRAERSAQAQQLRQIISILGRIKQVDSFNTLQPHLADPALQVDAMRALVQIAPALVKTEIAQVLKQELLKITPAIDPDLSKQATKIAAGIP